MEKKYLFLLLLLLTVGFASVNTYLDLNGKVDMSLLESDLDVVFKEVLLNKEKSENTIIIENGKSFIYSADDLTSENNTSNIDYVVMNRSHQYDVEVTVSCTTDYETYLNYNGTFDNQPLPLEKGILIEAGEVKIGNIVTELISENTSEESLVLKCTLNYIPVSRETVAKDEEYLVTLDSGYEEQLGDIKVKYYEEYSKLPELTRSNYKFLGWYTEEDIKVDNNSLVKIKGNHTLKAKWEKICEYDPGKVWTFDYTGSEQEFNVPCDGNYKLETWGAQGGNGSEKYYGGYGSYSGGYYQVSIGTTLYVVVGSSGTNAGYNGGSSDTYHASNSRHGGGGGASHISLKLGLLKNLSNALPEILIVAGGGGGGAYYIDDVNYCGVGGHGGGFTGDSGNPNSTMCFNYGSGGTQNAGGYGIPCENDSNWGTTGSVKGSFGQGGDYKSIISPSTYWTQEIAGGGSGLYGGATSWHGPAGGGSGYIGNPLLTNKAMYCYNCSESNEESTKTVSTTCVSSNPVANCAKQGNGYAKITLLSID